MKNKCILTDADGVLFDWEYAFDQWMKRHGYKVVETGNYQMNIKYGLPKDETMRLVRMFNESAWIRKLPPLRDAVHYVKKLHSEHGFIFHCITSLSNDDYSQHLRTKNLREMFGDSVFEKYIYLDTGADKDEILEPYLGSGLLWIEDKVENAKLGLELGLDSILIEHGHNMLTTDIPLMKDWKAVYEYVVG